MKILFVVEKKSIKESLQNYINSKEKLKHEYYIELCHKLIYNPFNRFYERKKTV